MKIFEWPRRMQEHRAKPLMRAPHFLGDFSLDHQREFHHDKRNLKFLISDFTSTKKVCFDLNKSYDKAKKKNFEETKKEKLDNLLRWILLNKQKFLLERDNSFTSLSTDFICFRGLLSELLCTPYEFREGWLIHAVKFAGTIYMITIETEEKKRNRLNMTEEHKRCSSWGYKFEQYMAEDNVEEGINENEEYCCVLRSRLDSHSIVYGAEVDGADKKLYHQQHSNLSSFLELKTYKEIISQKDERNFHKFKLKCSWAQCYLVGIPRLIYGFRDHEGLVKNLQSFKVEDIPRIARTYWNKNLMLNFLDDFLAWLKSVMTDDPLTVYEVTRLPAQCKITLRSLGVQTDSNLILPEWYTKTLFQNN